MSIRLIIIIYLSFIEIVKLHIYKKPAESVSDSTTSSRSEDRYSNNLEFDNIISDQREYKIIIFIL